MTNGQSCCSTAGRSDHPRFRRTNVAETHSTRNPGNVIHGHAFVGNHSRTYRSWNMMLQRCHNPKNTHFARYGGRGIVVCHRWRESFTAFLEDMGERPESRELERKDNNGNYTPENCRWATRKEQCQNTSRNRFIAFDGQTLSISEWARKIGVNKETLRGRLKNGMSVECALTTPTKPKGRQKCSVSGCDGYCWGKGLCSKHYQRARKTDLRERE